MTPLFWDWVDSEAALIQTDGCSKVSGAYRRWCRVHDLSYYFARDPVSAYLNYRLCAAGDLNYWHNAMPITKADADAAFRRGIQSDSAAGFFSPVALWRWLGVKCFGGKTWESHRQREHEAQEPAGV